MLLDLCDSLANSLNTFTTEIFRGCLKSQKFNQNGQKESQKQAVSAALAAFFMKKCEAFGFLVNF